MVLKRCWLGALVGLSLLCGCGSNDGDRAVGTVAEALSACDETVPATRFIDGFPAYAQCAATQNSAIYSNNGIDTATSAMGSDWVRTQWSGGYQCTELAHRYLLFKWNVTWLPNGNAGQWCDTMPPATSGVVQTMTPVHGDIMVFPPGSCGADGTTGHVAVVDVVGGPGAKLSAVQQNIASRSSYAPSCAKCFLHVVANDGSASGTGGAGGGPSTGVGGAPATGAGGSPPAGAGGFPSTGAGGFPSTGAGGTPPWGGPASGGAPFSGSGGVTTSVPGAGGYVPQPGGTTGGSAAVPPVGYAGTTGVAGASGGAGAPSQAGFGGAATSIAQAGASALADPAAGDESGASCTMVRRGGSPASHGELDLAAVALGLLVRRRRKSKPG